MSCGTNYPYSLRQANEKRLLSWELDDLTLIDVMIYLLFGFLAVGILYCI